MPVALYMDVHVPQAITDHYAFIVRITKQIFNSGPD
jgi:hypothetical protein